jgi:hypothetical protein
MDGMAKMKRQDMRRYALAGAEQRLLELGVEAAHIFRTFPELRSRGRGFDAIGEPGSGEKSGRTPRRRRRTMSAEARKRISDAQKARWAKHRSQSAAKTADGRKKK